MPKNKLTNQQILEKAIQKAIDGGWKSGCKLLEVWQPINTLDDIFVRLEDDSGSYRQFNSQAIIFNHDFAEALWGEEPVYVKTGDKKGDYYVLPEWQYRLQQMVIADDPLKYLGEHLDESN